MYVKIFKPFDSNLKYANLHVAIALGERVVAVVLLPHFSHLRDISQGVFKY